MMGDMPKPNANDAEIGEYPHLAFEVDHAIFQSEFICLTHTYTVIQYRHITDLTPLFNSSIALPV